MKRGSIKLLVALMGLVLLAGCAAPGMNVSVAYTPFVNATGGGGEIYLVQDMAPQISQKALWVIGSVKDSDGEKANDLVLSTMPADLVSGILADELTTAGYLVKQSKSMPEQAARAVRLSSVKLSLEENLSPLNFKIDGKASVSMGLELWDKGARLQTFEYRASSSDADFKEGDLLGALILKNSLRDIMKQAVPDIIKSLEKR
jgi:hypothetical protein